MLTVALAASAQARGHHPYPHHPECETARCARHADRLWARHHPPPPAPTLEALASWYDDAGGTACGTHYALGVAHKTLACGTRVELCHDGCEVAVVEDRGPFIAGREFDLNPGAKSAIGCSDLCAVRWRLK